MDEKTQAELAAMQAVHDALEPLDVDGRRRAVAWLVDKLGVELDG